MPCGVAAVCGCQRCHRRLRRWIEEGVPDEFLRALAEDLKEHGRLEGARSTRSLRCSIDGSFVGAKRGRSVGKTTRGKDTKLMALAGASTLPLAVHKASASPHEVMFVEVKLTAGFVGEKPERLIGDRDYDSDALDTVVGEKHRGERVAPE